MAKGFPMTALRRCENRCPHLVRDRAFARVLGTSPHHQGRRLTRQQSVQLWCLATVMVRAAVVFGGLEAAERWLARPAIGPGGRRPHDPVATPAGMQMATDHLTQLEYAVYV